MRVGMMLNSPRVSPRQERACRFSERAGLRDRLRHEAYISTRSPAAGFIAARRAPWRSPLASCPIYSRTPALTAMTAAGARLRPLASVHARPRRSGPQVIGLARRCPTSPRWDLHQGV